MKLIGKNNFWTIFCQAFTLIALIGMALDVISSKSMNYSQFNLMLIAIHCAVAVLILSQTYRLESLSPLAVIIIQYIVAVSVVLMLVWMSSLMVPIHPNGYRDAFVTFSIPYVIGEIIYCHKRKKELRRQNEELQMIKRLKDKKDC